MLPICRTVVCLLIVAPFFGCDSPALAQTETIPRNLDRRQPPPPPPPQPPSKNPTSGPTPTTQPNAPAPRR